MPTPSLILVPARFKTGKLYTPVATTSGGTVLGASGDFNVTRATTATRVNASGNIEVVASGIPRLDYFASGGVVGCPALLVEPQAQNIAQRSNELNTSPNVIEGTTFSGSVFVSPDGTQNAARFTETTANDRHGFYQYQNIASGANTVSIFTKETGRRYIAFASDFTGAGATSYFDLQTKSVLTNGSGHTGSVQDYGNGWLRLIVTIAASVSGSRYVIWGGSPSGTTNSYVGNVNISQTFYGLQIETGSVATSYIPTTTGSVTRNADVITLSGAVSGCIGQSEGTIYAEVDSRNQQSARIVSFQIAGTAGSGQVRIDTVGASLRCRVINASGTTVYDQTASPAMSVGINKVAFAFNAAASGIVVALNGSIINTGTASASTVHNATQLTIGAQDSIAGFGQFYNDRIRAVAIYATRLTNAELQSLTTL